MLTEIVLLLPVLWLAIYFWWTRKYNHWKKKRVPFEKPSFPYGNVQDVINGKENFGSFTKLLYDRYPTAKLVGFYGIQEPMIVVRDPELIKDVLIRDYNSFQISGMRFLESVDPMVSLNPFGLSGDKWKKFRSFQSQAHSISKLKGMVPMMSKSSQNFVQYLSKQTGKEIGVRELVRYFAVDAVASCAFSAECNSFENPNNPFAKETTDKMFTNNRAILSAMFAPWTSIFTRARLVSKVPQSFFTSLSKTLQEHRKKNNITQNDLVQLTIAYNERAVKEGKKPLTDIETAATYLALFLDGTETVSLVLGNTLYMLAAYPDIQNKLREEIKKNGSSIDDFDYDKVNSMEYLDMVISETLRTHPPIYILSRTCTSATQLDRIQIDEGTKVLIPLTGLYNDPKYFPNPDQFLPERFSKEGRDQFPKIIFLPFGEGPKACVGQRFGSLETKIGLVNLIMNFRVSLSPKHTTKYVPPVPSNAFVYWPNEDAIMKFEPV